MSKTILAIAVAGPRLFAGAQDFDRIHKGHVIRVRLPSGSCDAKVVRRDSNQLMIKLRNTTTTCGTEGNILALSRSEVRDVVRISGGQRVGHVIVAALASAGLVIAGIAIAFKTNSGAAGGAVIAGGLIAPWLLMPKAVRYEVLVNAVGP